MDELKRRKIDNGLRKYNIPNWIAVIILVLGFLFTFIASVKTIPALTETVSKNKDEIIELKTNYKWIKDGFDRLEKLIKEK